MTKYVTDERTEAVLDQFQRLARLIATNADSLHSRGDRDDLMQEAMIELWKRADDLLEKYDGEVPSAIASAVLRRRVLTFTDNYQHKQSHYFGHEAIGVTPEGDTLVRHKDVVWLDQTVPGFDDGTTREEIITKPTAETPESVLMDGERVRVLGERKAILMDAVKQLSPRQRQVIECSLKGMDSVETGKLLDIRPNNVTSHMTLARRRLRELLDGKLPDLAF